MARLDDAGTACASGLKFTMGGSHFDAVSVDLVGAVNRQCNYVDFVLSCTTYDNARLDGYRGGSLVVHEQFALLGSQSYTKSFGAAFSNLDELQIWSDSPPPGFMAMCGDVCSGFWVDNLTLALTTPSPVPLPGALLMFAAALGGFGWFARRRQ